MYPGARLVNKILTEKNFCVSPGLHGIAVVVVGVVVGSDKYQGHIRYRANEALGRRQAWGKPRSERHHRRRRRRSR